ncbi:hypothetical protein [Nitratireductor thuwali]|uniref:Uncharacterized protein n=1 Tax=Nitratireductor thuwali TaxID=2267699 RepID=A0ABY5MIW9_9HYPH|nr:hypothetical protein NTH_01668 [Nitratireductor thuwali]
MPDKIPPRKARQGRKGLPVLLVLVVALILLMIGWWAVEIYGVALDEQQPVEMPSSTEIPIERSGQVEADEEL